MENFCGLPVKTDIYKGVHITLETSVGSKCEFASLNADQFELVLQGTFIFTNF